MPLLKKAKDRTYNLWGLRVIIVTAYLRPNRCVFYQNNNNKHIFSRGITTNI